MTNPTIETDLSEILKEIRQDLKSIDSRLSKIEIGQAEIKGDIKALDTKVEQLDKRVANQEFLNRGVFIGLLLALLGGVVNFFGWIPKE
jgi:septal ring factor EnvC (AmiA/AmiB activator)